MTDLIKRVRELCERAKKENDYSEPVYGSDTYRLVIENAPALADALEAAQGEIEGLKSRNQELECAYSAYDGSALERADKHIELQEAAIHDLLVRAEKAEAELCKACSAFYDATGHGWFTCGMCPYNETCKWRGTERSENDE